MKELTTTDTQLVQAFYYDQLDEEVQKFYDDIEQQVSDTNDQWRTAIGTIIQQVIDVRGRDEALAWFMHRFQKSQTTFYKYLRLANGEDTWAIEREQKQHKAIAEKAQFLQNSVNDELLSELEAQLTAAAQNRIRVEKEHAAPAIVVDEKPPDTPTQQVQPIAPQLPQKQTPYTTYGDHSKTHEQSYEEMQERINKWMNYARRRGVPVKIPDSKEGLLIGHPTVGGYATIPYELLEAHINTLLVRLDEWKSGT